MGRNRKVRGALSQTLTHGVRAILERNLKTNEFIGFAAMIIGDSETTGAVGMSWRYIISESTTRLKQLWNKRTFPYRIAIIFI